MFFACFVMFLFYFVKHGCSGGAACALINQNKVYACALEYHQVGQINYGAFQSSKLLQQNKHDLRVFAPILLQLSG